MNDTTPPDNGSPAPELAYRPSRVNAAQEYPALRRFHFILFAIAIFKLLLVTVGYSNREAATEKYVSTAEKASKESGVRSTAKQRAQWEEEYTRALNQSLILELADALIMLACACLVFHFPFATTGIASLLYFINSVFVVMVIALSTILPPFGWMAIGVRISIQLLLLKAFHVAWKFQDEFTYRELERQRLAASS